MNDGKKEGTTRPVAGVLLLSALAVALRLPGLRSLPIFGDEAIFLRLAALIREDPSRHFWVALRAAQAPFHTWLLALSLPLSPDPVLSGRLLSVLMAALAVPALALSVSTVVRTLVSAEDARRWARPASFLSAVLMIASPFFSFAQRLARVESLFVLESILAVWASLRIAEASPGLIAIRRIALPGSIFGLLMGILMLTRQALAYVLWILPFATWVLLPRERRAIWPLWAARVGLALALAVAIWLPVLFAPSEVGIADRLFHFAQTRPEMPAPDRIGLFVRNLGITGAAFLRYLTLPVAFLCVAAPVALAALRYWRLLAFLLLWEILLLGPPALFAINFFPRYAVAAAVPFLVATAVALAALWHRPRRSLLKASAGRFAVAAVIASVLFWGLRDSAVGATDWRRQRFLPIDRWQFVSGWPAGAASEAVVRFLAERARQQTIVVIVPQISGNPSDAVWLLLRRNRGVRLFYSEDFLRHPVLPRAQASRYAVIRGDIWAGETPTPVELDAGMPVFFVCPDPVSLGRPGGSTAQEVIPPRNPGARLIARFENPPNEKGEVESAVALFRLR